MRSVYLDFDGTIVDIRPRYFTLYERTLQRLGQPCLSREEYWRLKRRRVTEQVIVGMTAPLELFPAYQGERSAGLESPAALALDRPFPGARRALARLACTHRLVLVTGRWHGDRLLVELEALGLREFFMEVLVTGGPGDSGWAQKAKAIALREPSGSDVIAGDCEDEVLAGKCLGLTTVSFCSGIRTRAFLSALTPDFILPALPKLPEILTSRQV